MSSPTKKKQEEKNVICQNSGKRAEVYEGLAIINVDIIFTEQAQRENVEGRRNMKKM
jgi:hypothetical protein